MRNIRAYGAEFLGTFLLAGVVRLALSSQNLPVATPVIAALMLGLCVYLFGTVSGSHVNPAVTIALASVRKITVGDAVSYVVAQFLGATVALLAVNAFTGGSLSLSVDQSLTAGIAEAVGAFVFLLGIASVVYRRTPSAVSGVVIGSSLLLGILASRGGGILNPAVALALGSLSAPQALGPIVGGVIAVWVYRSVVGEAK